jgi:hypothetical protein
MMRASVIPGPTATNRSIMRASGTIRAQRPSVVRWLAGDLHRTVLICGFALTICAAAVLVASWSGSASRSRAAGDADLSTGSMLVVSPGGDMCAQRTIDNSTWQIKNIGFVNCDEALSKAANGGADHRTPGSRLQAIREGFVGKP